MTENGRTAAASRPAGLKIQEGQNGKMQDTGTEVRTACGRTRDGRLRSISLIGFMGSGKTTVGRILSRKTGYCFTDTDERIERRTGMTIPEIFSKYGEPFFRDLETQELTILLAEEQPMVISVGGGLPMREENRALLKELGVVVFLEASEEELVRRLKSSSGRPMLEGGNLRERIHTLMNERMDRYVSASTVRIFTDGMRAAGVADEIIRETGCRAQSSSESSQDNQ